MDDLDITYDSTSKTIVVNSGGDVPEPKGLGYFLYKCLLKNGSSIAQIDAETGFQETYSEYLSKCVGLAEGLKLLGIKKGDIVTICTENNLKSSLPFIALQFIGAIYSATDPSICLEDQKHLLNLVKPKLVLASEKSQDLMEAALFEIGHAAQVICFESPQFEELMLCDKFELDLYIPYTTADANETALLHFSSGTTDLPKAVCISHNSIMHVGIKIYERWSTKGVILTYAAPYWISKSWCTILAVYSSCPSLVCSKFEAEIVWSYVDKYKVNFMMLPPSQVIKALPHLPKDWNKGPDYLLVGGSSITSSNMKKLSTSLPKTLVIQGYGQTEVGTITGGKQGHPSVLKYASCGMPMPGIQIRVVDEESGRALGYNELGEFRVKPLYPMVGYYNQDSLNCWDEDGFFKTGDVGYYDEDFCFYITDRCKDMFKYITWHITPAKLETVLLGHPDVHMAAVIGIPHPEDDNHAMGVVVLNDNATVTGEDLEKYVESQVDERNRLRAGVKIIESLPMTPSCKVKKRQLRDMFVAESIK